MTIDNNQDTEDLSFKETKGFISKYKIYLIMLIVGMLLGVVIYFCLNLGIYQGKKTMCENDFQGILIDSVGENKPKDARCLVNYDNLSNNLCLSQTLVNKAFGQINGGK